MQISLQTMQISLQTMQISLQTMQITIIVILFCQIVNVNNISIAWLCVYSMWIKISVQSNL